MFVNLHGSFCAILLTRLWRYVFIFNLHFWAAMGVIPMGFKDHFFITGKYANHMLCDSLHVH